MPQGGALFKKGSLGVILVLVSASVVSAQSIPNWPAPPTWKPPISVSAGRIRALAETPPVPFIPITPCRQFDIRPGTLADNTNLTIALSGAPCGIPSAASAVSVNITVFSISGAGGNGVFRVGIANDPPTAWINYPPTETQRANAGAVATDGAGNIVVKVNQGGGTIQLTVDVNGYYGNTPANQSNGFNLFNNSSLYSTMYLVNSSPSCNGVCTLYAQTNSTNDGRAILGAAIGLSGVNYGVLGVSSSTSFGAAGVRGQGSGGGQTIGVEGICTSGPPNSLCTGMAGRGNATGGYFTSNGTGGTGVIGLSFGTAGAGVGVSGSEASSALDSAGVKGVDSSGSLASIGSYPAGVRGESKSNLGVVGFAQNPSIASVGGYLVNSSGSLLSWGALGYSPTAGVYYSGGLAGSGPKSFVEPHPTDASKVIRYVSLEGPEAGTYFRGTDQTNHGTAVIEVPESFRLVTDTEGLTVQLTPIGAAATIYVVSQDLTQIVVRASLDVKFHYMVNGVRKAYPHWVAIQENEKFFVPESASARMPVYLSEEERGRLIRNGTYNADGTVNMETAERVGWAKLWAEREAERQAAAAEARKAIDEGRR